MFQGQSYGIRQIDKNRYEFRSAYTHKLGTLSEIKRVVSHHAIETARSAVELETMKQKLRDAGAAEEVATASLPPVTVVEPTARSAQPIRAMARHRAAKAKPAPKNHVDVIDLPDAKTKRRPGGLYFLRQLQAEAEAEAEREKDSLPG